MKIITLLFLFAIAGCTPPAIPPQQNGTLFTIKDSLLTVYGDSVTQWSNQNYQIFIALAEAESKHVHASWHVGRSFCDSLSTILHWHFTVGDTCQEDTNVYIATVKDTCRLALNGRYRYVYIARNDTVTAFEVDIRWWRYNQNRPEAQSDERFYIWHNHN